MDFIHRILAHWPWSMLYLPPLPPLHSRRVLTEQLRHEKEKQFNERKEQHLRENQDGHMQRTKTIVGSEERRRKENSADMWRCGQRIYQMKESFMRNNEKNLRENQEGHSERSKRTAEIIRSLPDDIQTEERYRLNRSLDLMLGRKLELCPLAYFQFTPLIPRLVPTEQPRLEKVGPSRFLNLPSSPSPCFMPTKQQQHEKMKKFTEAFQEMEKERQEIIELWKRTIEEIKEFTEKIKKFLKENQDGQSERSKRAVESEERCLTENSEDKWIIRERTSWMEEITDNIKKCPKENQDGHSKISKMAVVEVSVIINKPNYIDEHLSENYADFTVMKTRRIESEERCLTENSDDMWRSWGGLHRSEERCLTENSENMRRSLDELYRSEERCLTENSFGMWRSWGGLYRGSKSGYWIIQEPQNLIILSKSEIYMFLQNTLKGSKYQCFVEKDTSLCDNESPIENSDERKLELLKAKNKELDKEMKEKLQRCIHRLNGMRFRKPMQKRQLATI